MPRPMGLDIRTPLGAMFVILGGLLTLYGAATHGDAARYARSLGIDVNLWWGVALLVFGVILLLLARRGARAEGVHPAMQTPEGRATERREERLGLEE